MKILSIRLKNLASIEGYFDIDFTTEPLQSAGIFAISGPTGAGKSTILDALCLALYDKTPRFATTGENLYLKDVGESQVNQSDVKNILRRGTGEGFAEVVFMGVDGFRYQSRWSVRRARSKADGSLQAQTMQVTNLDKEEELQGTKTELLNRLTVLIGLNYDQFTRTVLLAQNDFATFLKSKESAKAELLEKLTGTEIYSQISKAIFQHTKIANEELNQIRNRASVIKLLPDEELQVLEQNRTAFRIKREEISKQLESLTEKLKLIQSLKTQEEVLAKKHKEEATGQENLLKLQTLFAQQTAYLTDFRQKCADLQPDIRKARELDVRIQGAQANFKQVEQSIAGIRSKQPTTIQLSLEHLDAEQKTNEERSRRLNTFDIQNLGNEQTALLQQQKKLQEAKQLTAEWLTLQKTAEELSKDLQQKRTSYSEKEKEQTVFASRLTSKQVEVKTLQNVFDGLRIAMGKDVKALRQALISGEACPVCGSLEHPYSQKAEAIESHYRQVEKDYKTASEELQKLNNHSISLQRDIKHLLETCEQQQSRLTILQAEIERKCPKNEEERSIAYFDLQLEELRNKQEGLSEKLREYQQLYEEWLWYDYKIKESVLSALLAERKLLLKGKSVDEAELSMQRKEKELTDALETARKNAEINQARISGVRGEIKQLTAAVEVLRKEYKQIESPEKLPETIDNCQKHKVEIEKQLSVMEAQLLQQEESRKLQKEIETALKEKEAVAEKWEKLNKLFGSADGSKFKVIAQSYTLNLLLMHANKHLSYLSKRYKLQQVPDTLALQVIDCDMCDEIRTVYSLSGGESFLISLALALGLSSLSGNNLKVESLFIDEGFGSLDADSLRTAMDALEQLQLQGRKIGVISHVREMSERIPVQIQIHKTINGKSYIQIT
ncbi:AAA family ATPase [Bacteroides sp. 224]|uniref:AAA family ATPase n=1 Tax=Bacteroides sp. 224 TaxID=2302936 RepID=UPI0013CF4611|nr:AAA family ATPase [Bacteroides sp. 224]NDV65125.1 ATP-dependent endonuclease [Bacteroides sp. 224]